MFKNPHPLDVTGRIPVLVVGIGNLLMGDDGLGVHAVQAMMHQPHDDQIVMLDGGTAALSIVPEIERADRVLLIDALQAGHAPGTLLRLDAQDIAMPGIPRSLHEYGVSHILAQLAPDKRPETLCVIGLEPGDISLGTDLSEPVRAALPSLIQTASKITHDWLSVIALPSPMEITS